MKKLLGYCFTLPFLLVWFVLLNLFHVLQVVARNTLGGAAHRKVVDGLNGCLIHSLALLGTHCSVRLAGPLPRGRPLIFVANHQNKLDIVGISWYLRRHQPIFVSKIELASGIPSVSYNLRHSGAALIDRSDPRQALREIGRLGSRIEATQGAAVIFPEGTRSTSGVIASFQSAGVKILLKNAPDAVVVPIYIHDTWKVNRYGSFPMSFGEHLSWNVLPAIDPGGRSSGDVVAAAEAAIRSAQAQLTGGRC